MIAQLGVVLCALVAELPAGHPKIEPDEVDGGVGLTSAKLIEQLDAMKGLSAKEKTFDVAATIGRLYYSAGRYADASQYLEQAVAKGEPARRPQRDRIRVRHDHLNRRKIEQIIADADRQQLHDVRQRAQRAAPRTARSDACPRPA